MNTRGTCWILGLLMSACALAQDEQIEVAQAQAGGAYDLDLPRVAAAPATLGFAAFASSARYFISPSLGIAEFSANFAYPLAVGESDNDQLCSTGVLDVHGDYLIGLVAVVRPSDNGDYEGFALPSAEDSTAGRGDTAPENVDHSLELDLRGLCDWLSGGSHHDRLQDILEQSEESDDTQWYWVTDHAVPSVRWDPSDRFEVNVYRNSDDVS